MFIFLWLNFSCQQSRLHLERVTQTPSSNVDMSDVEHISDYEELADFIVKDDDVNGESGEIPGEEQEEEEPSIDRLATLTNTLRTTESPTNRILKAHISILVSALGGPDHASEDGFYKLGHDALACLRDIKRWIKSVDERNSTSDVALACADCGLLQNDLTVILCQWDKPAPGVTQTRTTDKIMIACLELMVLLTWPTEVDRKAAVEEYSSKARTRLAQLRYKHHILTYRNGKTIKAVIRLGLHALKIPEQDREPRDLSILRLIVYFLRNILYIEPLPESNGKKAVSNFLRYPSGISPDDLSIASILPVLQSNNALVFLTSIAHSVLANIRDEQFGLLTMECLYLITRELQAETFFQETNSMASAHDATKVVPPASAAAGLNLSALLSEEDKRKKHLKSLMSTRHGRFGTLLSLQNSSNASYLAVSGQKALASTRDTLEKLDSTKKWHKTSTFRYDSNSFVRAATASLYGKTAQIFLTFIDQLLSSGSFNNLLKFVSRYLTNLANDEIGRAGILHAIDSHELASYFLTVSWFFRFKRNKSEKLSNTSLSPKEDGIGYGSVGAALSEVNFILLTSYLRSSFESRDYNSLHVAMVCFREMLLIANSIFSKKRTQEEINLISEEDINEDRELAEGIIRKLFSQKEFLDMCVNIPKSADKHSPEFLKVVVSVVHILLKSFETLSNEDVHLFIKTRRRMRKLQNNDGLNQQMDREHWHLIDRGSDEEDDEEEIKIITRERKLDYRNTEVRFFHPEIVSTHIKYLSRYEEMSHDEIKRGISYFHKLFVVHKDYSMLYRLDFMMTLQNLQTFLPRSSSIRRHVDEFVIYFMKKFQESLLNFPTAIEVLFPRFENLEYKGFLSTGDLEFYDSRSNGKTLGSKTNSYFDSEAVQPRAATIMQFVDAGKSLDEKIGAITYHLMKKKNTTKLLALLSEEFARIATSISHGNKSALSLRLNLANRRLVISELLVRLLLEIVGFNLPFLQNDDTTLRANSLKDTLVEAGVLLKKWLQQHVAGTGDIEPFLDQFQLVIFTSEQLNFGKKALEKQRAGEILVQDADLHISEDVVHTLIGLARRREYDEQVAATYYAEDDMEDYSLDANNANTLQSQTMRSSRRSQHNNDEILDGLDDYDSDAPKQNRNSRKKTQQQHSQSQELPFKPAISAELVADSDDDSDSEENRLFFEREEKLRQLIASRGGVANKEDLKAFQDSWSNLVTPQSRTELRNAVSNASLLFVAELDDEDYDIIKNGAFIEKNGTAEDGLKRKSDPVEVVTRKRRMILDEDDD